MIRTTIKIWRCSHMSFLFCKRTMHSTIGKTLTLSDGHIMPTLSLGTYFGMEESVKDNNDAIINLGRNAIEVGYRHIDAAWRYATEEQFGQALKDQISAGVLTRHEMFVTSKLSLAHHDPSSVESALRQSLKNLQVDYLDLYLLHGPFAVHRVDPNSYILLTKDTKLNQENDHIETWKAMERCVKLGLCRSIGVSSFNSAQIQNLLDNCDIKPANNQIEIHPYLQQPELVDYCLSRNVSVTAFTPLGQPHSSLVHNKTPAQVALRYQIQRGVCVTVKSSSTERLRENLQIFDFELTQEEMTQIKSLDKKMRYNQFKLAAKHKDYPFHVEY